MRRNRRGRNNRMRSNRIPPAVKGELHGKKTKPRADPTSITQIPWWPLTIETTVSIPGSLVVYNMDALMSDFAKQTSISLNSQDMAASLRIISVTAWETTGKKLGLYPYDWTKEGGETDILVNLQDTPARNAWARLGYKWPASYSTQVLNTGGEGHNTNIFAFDARDPLVSNAQSPGVVTIHLKILWKRRVLSRPTVLYSDLPQIETADPVIFQNLTP